MKHFLIPFVILWFTAATFASETKVQLQPFGFNTIDFSENYWNSIGEDQKLKGAIRDLFSYKDVKRVLIMRCNMSVHIGGSALEHFMQDSLKATNYFYTGRFPGWKSAYKYPLLTALMETEVGGFILLNIYPEFSTLEINGKCGMILNKN